MATTYGGWVAGLAGVFAASGAQAQPVCGLKNNVRVVTTVNESTCPGELVLDTGWISGQPTLITPADNACTNAMGCHSEAHFVMESSYGVLRYQGQGSAVTCPFNGVFLWTDEAIGGEPKAKFRDRVTATSATLAAGTPAMIRVSAEIYGGAFASGVNPEHTFQASLLYGTNILFTSASVPGGASQTLTLDVGSSLDLVGGLLCTLRNREVQGAGPSGTIGANLQARFRVVSLTPGVSLVSCSGHDYTDEGCAADFDDGSGSGVPDGGVTIDDLIYYVDLFQSGSVAADIDDGSGTGTPDGGVTIDDLIYFLVRFEAGC